MSASLFQHSFNTVGVDRPCPQKAPWNYPAEFETCSASGWVIAALTCGLIPHPRCALKAENWPLTRKVPSRRIGFARISAETCAPFPKRPWVEMISIYAWSNCPQLKASMRPRAQQKLPIHLPSAPSSSRLRLVHALRKPGAALRTLWWVQPTKWLLMPPAVLPPET